jgi:hypothetical protein
MERFLLAGPMLPFTIALGAMAALVLLELIGLMFGAALSHLLDSALPDFEFDLDHDGVPDNGFFAGLSWLHVGVVPLMALIMIAAGAFGLSGLLAQILATRFSGLFLDLLVAVPIALVGMVFGIRSVGGLAAKYLFREDSTAVSDDSFIGRPATIVLGTSKRGQPSQAKLTDQHGQVHYVLVEPLQDDKEFSNGETVILLKRDGARFFVVEDSVDALSALETTSLRVGETPQVIGNGNT